MQSVYAKICETSYLTPIFVTPGLSIIVYSYDDSSLFLIGDMDDILELCQCHVHFQVHCQQCRQNKTLTKPCCGQTEFNSSKYCWPVPASLPRPYKAWGGLPSCLDGFFQEELPSTCCMLFCDLCCYGVFWFMWPCCFESLRCVMVYVTLCLMVCVTVVSHGLFLCVVSWFVSPHCLLI